MAYFTINNPDWDGNEWICAPPTAGMHDAAYDVVREPCLPLELRPPYLEGIRLTQENGMDDASHPHHVMYCGLPNSIFFKKPLFPYILSDKDVFGNQGAVNEYELKDAWYNESELDDKKGHIPYTLTSKIKKTKFVFDTGEYGYDHVIVPGNAFEASKALTDSKTLNKVTVNSVLSEKLMIPVLRVKEEFDEKKLRYNIHFVAPPVWGQFIPSWDVTVYYDNYQLPWWAYQIKLSAINEEPTKATISIVIAGITEEIDGGSLEIVPLETLKTKGKFSIPDPRGVMFRDNTGKLNEDKKYVIVPVPRGITACVPDVLVNVEYNGKKYPLNCKVVDTKDTTTYEEDKTATRYEWKHVKYVVSMDETEAVIDVGTGDENPVVVYDTLK